MPPAPDPPAARTTPQGLGVPSEAVVRGDAKCSCVAAASIIAKVIAEVAGEVRPRTMAHALTAGEAGLLRASRLLPACL